MSHLLDEHYFEWLYAQVANVKARARSRTYSNLLRLLYRKEFVWFVPNDDNRAEDGRYLRHDFKNDTGFEIEDAWMHLPCSMLEMLIALARRAAFESEGTSKWWFWHFIQNLGLNFSDALDIDPEEVDEVLETVIWRQYGPDGHGGLFPLKYPREDQRKVELWYQLSAYLLEH